MKPHVFRPAAAADIERAYVWYERERAGLGEEFLAEIFTAFKRCSKGPRHFRFFIAKRAAP